MSLKSKESNMDRNSKIADEGIEDSTPYIPSADALAKIESSSFVPEKFVSQRSKKDEGKSPVNSEDQSHEDAIFGVSARVPPTKPNVEKASEIRHKARTEGSGIMSSLLHERMESKNDRWMKKLHSMRQKKLLNHSGQILS